MKHLLLFFSLLSMQGYSQHTNVNSFQNINFYFTESLKNAKNIKSISQYQLVRSSSGELDYKNKILEFQFNEKGELSSQKEGYGRIQSIKLFEKSNNVLTIKDFDGLKKLLKVTRIMFNQKGNFLHEYVYNSENQQIGITNYVFDNNDKLVEVQEKNDERTVIKKIGENGKYKSLFYRYTNGDSTNVFYFYEGNKIITKSSQVVIKSKEATYDSYIEDIYDENNQVIENYSKFGNLEGSRKTFKYNKNGQQVEYIEWTNDNKIKFKRDIVYDENGNMVTV